MNDKVVSFQKRFSEIAVDCQKFCFMTKAKELQEEARDMLTKLYDEAHSLKLDIISQEDEDAANAMLSFEEIITALRDELNMWIALKEDNPGSAWDYLVNAQRNARNALQVHSVGDHLTGYIQHLDILEHVLFPPQKFMSVGIIVLEAECSICGEEYGECDHIKGKPYMGEQCVRIINHVAQLEDVSIVDNPANKHCRIISFSDGDVMRDLLTWRVVKRDEKSVTAP
jgi:hypothetical protein